MDRSRHRRGDGSHPGESDDESARPPASSRSVLRRARSRRPLPDVHHLPGPLCRPRRLRAECAPAGARRRRGRHLPGPPAVGRSHPDPLGAEGPAVPAPRALPRQFLRSLEPSGADRVAVRPELSLSPVHWPVPRLRGDAGQNAAGRGGGAERRNPCAAQMGVGGGTPADPPGGRFGDRIEDLARRHFIADHLHAQVPAFCDGLHRFG